MYSFVLNEQALQPGVHQALLSKDNIYGIMAYIGLIKDSTLLFDSICEFTVAMRLVHSLVVS